MRVGIFAKTFVRPTLAETLDAVLAHGLAVVQFNMACAGLPTLPERFDESQGLEIGAALRSRGLTVAAVSGTFNMIDPDRERLAANLRRLDVLASACRSLDTTVITLCTGTRDRDDMWRRHPENDSEPAWITLVSVLKDALAIAETHDVTLAFEPEIANVIDSALKGRRLLDQIGSSRLKVVIDPANLFHPGELPRMREVLDEAFALIGRDIILAHAKDLDRDCNAGALPAGQGVLDFDGYVQRLHDFGFDGPLILHGLAESQVDASVAFLHQRIAKARDD